MRRILNKYGIVRDGVYVEWPGALDTPSALEMQLQRLPLEIRPKRVALDLRPPHTKLLWGFLAFCTKGKRRYNLDYYNRLW